jgi:hypothetical protein
VEAKQNLNLRAPGAPLACLLMMVVLAVGCSSQSVRGPVDARAAGGLDARSGRTLVPGDLAFGRDVALASRSEQAPGADIDAYLKPQPAAPARIPARTRMPAPAAPVLPPPPAIALAPESAAQTEQTAPQPLLAANTLSGGDLERYAQREQRSRDVQGYRGGDAIVITSGALIVALLIVLLIVLLT